MRILVTKILSLHTDGASCYLLNIGNQIKILLDCGLPRDLNFQKYIRHKSEIQSVNLILISHSSIQYSGALPLLITEFNIQPKIFYTTQPVMRYSPLNFHEEVLNMRHPNYDKKIFNKIYTYFQSIQVIKPYQKKVIAIETSTQSQSLLKGNSKTVHFSSYQAGGALSSICWKIRSGLVNIVYLVDFNNFSLNHINGLDLEAVKNQPISLLLTDMYPMIADEKIKKDKLYIEIKKTLLEFYVRQGIDPTRPKPFLGQNQRKLLITCYPNQMLIQLMITLRKVITDLQEVAVRQKVVVVHLSSRYLQLIKSQVDNFSQQTKPLVDKIDQFFIHSRSMTCRINISSFNQINGILNSALINNPNVQIVHFGEEISASKTQRQLSIGKQNISHFKLFRSQNQLQQKEQKPQSSLKQEEKIQEEIQIKEEEMDKDKDEPDNINLKIQRSLSSMIKRQKQNMAPFDEAGVIPTMQKPKALVGKYLSQISFPHFIKSNQQQEFDFNDYGLKHHLQPSARPPRRTINDLNFNQNQQLPQLSLIAKKSIVEVMNIEFGVQENCKCIDVATTGKIIENYAARTNFTSSLKIMQILNPKHVFILNSSPDTASQRVFKQYKAGFKNQLYNLATSPKNQCVIQIQNQLVEYKVNYLPLGQHPLQKVKGRVESINGVIHLHIQILQEKQILQFRLQKFYRQCKNHFGKALCKFTGNGIMVSGIKIYRQGYQIIFEGEYSESYFKVRKMLYQFLHIK